MGGAIEERLRRTIELARVGLCNLDADGRFTMVNGRFCEMLGCHRDELLDRSALDVTYPPDREAGSAVLAEMLEGRRTIYEGEERYVHSSGRIVWARVAAEAVRDSEGRFEYSISVVQDITAERESTQLFESFFEITLDPLCIAGQDGRFIRVNGAFQKALGYTAHELTSRPYMDFVHPEDQGITLTQMERLAQGKRVLRFQNRYRARDGSYRTFLWIAYPLEHTDLIYAGARDITQDQEREAQLRASEERYRKIVELAHEGIFTLDTEGRVTFANRRFTQLLGFAEGDILGRYYLDLLEPQGHDEALQRFERRRQGESQQLDVRFIRADGTYLWAIASSTPIFEASGEFAGVLAMVADISERKAAETAQKANESRLASLVAAQHELAACGADALDRAAQLALELTPGEGSVVELSDGNRLVRRAAAGHRPAELGLAASVWATGCPMICQDAEHDPRVDADVCRRRGIRSFVATPLHSDDRQLGLLKVFSGRVRAFSDGDVQSIQLLAEALGNLVLRQRANDRLEASERQYRLLFDDNPHAMWVSDRRTLRFLAVNAAAVRRYGYTREEFLEMRTTELELPEGGHKTRSGSVRDVEVSSDDITFNDVAARLTLVQDVTELTRMSAQLREQASLLDKAQDAILVRDLQHRITFWNTSAQRLYGWSPEEVLGQPVQWLLYKDQHSFSLATARTLEKGEWMGELRQFTKDGRELTVEGRWTLVRDESGEPRSILAINTDITERKNLERQFLRAQRMESIGTLAGGIAHDLNNVLVPIMVGVELLEDTEDQEQRADILSTMRDSAQRGADMVRQVLNFARGVDVARTSVDVAKVIEEVSRLTAETFDRKIRVRTELAPDLWLVNGDVTQIHQLLLNLCVNARDAMLNGGELTIKADNLVADAQFAATHPEAREGRYVRLTVADTGEGMPPHVASRIFEPFYTTKEVGQGTGLGLSTVQAVVRSHAGFVTVYSEVGRGSSFNVCLPVGENEALLTADEPGEAPRGRGELILVVDDEPSVRNITRQTLEAFGYRVLTAEDGAEALALFVRQIADIELVLTDMNMPVMDGYATIRALRRIQPEVRILAASGLGENAAVARAASLGVRHFLPKPYTASTLLRTLRAVLEDAAPIGVWKTT